MKLTYKQGIVGVVAVGLISLGATAAVHFRASQDSRKIFTEAENKLSKKNEFRQQKLLEIDDELRVCFKKNQDSHVFAESQREAASTVARRADEKDLRCMDEAKKARESIAAETSKDESTITNARSLIDTVPKLFTGAALLEVAVVLLAIGYLWATERSKRILAAYGKENISCNRKPGETS